MTSEQLLQEIQGRKLLTEEAIAKLRRETAITGKSAEELIYEQRLIPDLKVAEVKSGLIGVPFERIDLEKIDKGLMEFVPEDTVRNYAVAPLLKKDNLLVVGMVHPDDAKAQDALKFIAQRSRLSLGVYLISYGDWQSVLRKYSPFKSNIEAAVRSLNVKPGESGTSRKVVRLDEDISKGGDEAPIIKIVSDTFKEAVQGGASDIHLEPQENYFRVRFRVNGELKEEASLPAEIGQPIISRIKVLSNLKIDETRVPQDGRFRSKILDHEIDFRVATFPTPLGEKMAVRVLDPTTGLKSFDDLGLAGNNLETLKAGLLKPYGMILITGPTGSGKTTTLYALLQALNKEDVNIVSLEDPVEYFVSGINQSQVRPEIGYDFASGLRQILRQDPDVIMVGEIRDDETASLAVQAALTGHIVLSTLHTNNAAGVIPRLLDMKVPPFLLPVSLNLMVAQRLLGVLCSDCKKAEEAPEPIQKIFDKALLNLPNSGYKRPYQIYHAPGCAKCNNRGVTGRMGIFEVFKMTPSLEDLISSGATMQKLAKEAEDQGMVTLRQDGVIKALQGHISAEEVLRVTEEG